jgi:hypothetical protein
LQQVDPNTFALLATLDLTHGPPTLRTGDVYVIQYSTNVPGQVWIDNVDSQGVTTSLGTYNVLPGRDNRIPTAKGIQLTGSTGLERFRLFFFPCTPPEARDQSQATPMAAGLPTCTRAPSSKLALASKGLLQPKRAVNLESPDPSIAVETAADYQSDDVTTSEFQLQHAPR